MFYINSLSIFNLSRSLLCEILTEIKANASDSTNCGWPTETPHVLFTSCCFSTDLPYKISNLTHKITHFYDIALLGLYVQ